MKKSKVIFLALLACAFGASAETVTKADAEYAARRWATSGAVLEKSIGQKVVSSETLTATNSAVLHVVRFDGGTAFVSGDTELEPIVAFTTATNFTPSADNKLWALLKRDTIVRNAALRFSKSANLKTTASAGFSAQISASTNAAAGKWAVLLEGRRSQKNSFAFGATPPNKLDGVTDVRCAPLLKSQWSQTEARGHYCYNLYTPNHDPCGCTATAMSQIMRYHEYPKESVKAKTYTCTVDGKTKKLTMQGGTYDWGKMTLCPNDSPYVAENWEAIGKLTSDAGIAIKSSYTAGAGSSYVSQVSEALKEAFGYANGVCIFNWGIAEEALYGDGRVYSEKGLHALAIREKVIYANLDAKCPVELGVYGYADEQIGDENYWEGHAIVGDGYGYSEYGGEKVPYVHINLGWHGRDDAWYNIPEIHSPNSGSYIGSEGTAFTVLSAAAYNIFPTNTGNIVAGRVFDDDGDAMSGVKMSIRETGTDVVLGERMTDEQGIYSFIVPGGKNYDITCLVAKKGIEDTHTVNVPKDTLECSDEYGVYTEKDAHVGNYWGHDADFEIVDPCVTNVTQGMAYTRLDRALEAAANGDVLEIIREAPFKKPVTVGVDCTIVATNADAAVSQVIRNQGALLTIAASATVTLSNVAFAASTESLVVVEGGGCLKLGPKVDMGVDIDHVSVSTADATGLDLAGDLTRKFLFHCDAATVPGETFCTYSCDEEVAERCAEMFVCADDDDRKTRGKVGLAGTLAWTTADVPIDEAFGYFVDANGFTNTFAQAEKAFDNFKKALGRGDASEFIVRKPGTFPVCFDEIVLPAVIRGEGEPRPVLTATSTSGFRILDGGSLMVSNVVFRGYEAPLSGGTFIEVNGGELTLDDGAVLDGIVGRAYRASGVVDLLAGAVTMLDGSAIVNCSAEGTSAQGGAIYMECSDGSYDCTLNIFGGTVSNCQAVSYGGGIYVAANEGRQGEVNLSGRVVIVDNGAGATTDGPDDLYILSADEMPYFKLVGELGENSHVGIRYSSSSSSGNAEDDAFMTNAVGAVSRDTLNAFFNDTTNTLEAAIGDNGMLVWKKKDMSGTCSEDDATTHVYYPDGGEAHYPDLATAFAHMTNGTVATVKMYKDGKTSELFDADVELPSGCKVVLMSGGDVGYEFLRAGDVGLTVAAGASLTLTNVLFRHVDHNSATKPYFAVVGGLLTLSADSYVAAGTGNTNRDANGITVSKGGVFTILSGAKVCDCYSSWNLDKFTPDTATQYYAVGGGVLIDDGSTANLRGGEITSCHAPRGGGLYACNGSKVYVSGDFKIVGNEWIPRAGGVGGASNLLVTDLSELYLDDVLTGDVHVANSVRWRGDTNIVAMVAAPWQWGVTALTNSASHFISDETGDFGVVVTNVAEKIIVWSRAVHNGVFVSQDTVRDDKTFYVVADEDAYTPLSLSPLPELDPNAKTADAVRSALTISDLADKSVEESINGSVNPVEAYEDFREWAVNGIGSIKNVVESDKAGVSYDFGTTELLTEDPAVEIVKLVETDDGLEISVVVKDGEDSVEVASKKVAEMLEGSTDVAAWDDNRTELEVTDLTQSTADEVSFKVKPADDVPAAFIRVKR